MLEFFIWCSSHPGAVVPDPVLRGLLGSLADGLADGLIFCAGMVYLSSMIRRRLGPARWSCFLSWLDGEGVPDEAR